MNGLNFTERTRKVLALARTEASRLHHEFAGTEHILLGLIREGEGVGTTVLQNLSVDLAEIQAKVEATVKKGNADTPLRPDLPYTSRAKKVLEFAMAEAHKMDHSYVGTEHLLLGLLAEEKGIAAQVLNISGVTLAAARAETMRLLGNVTTGAAPQNVLVGRLDSARKPLSYTVEIEYDAETTVRRRFVDRDEALRFLVTGAL